MSQPKEHLDVATTPTTPEMKSKTSPDIVRALSDVQKQLFEFSAELVDVIANPNKKAAEEAAAAAKKKAAEEERARIEAEAEAARVAEQEANAKGTMLIKWQKAIPMQDGGGFKFLVSFMTALAIVMAVAVANDPNANFGVLGLKVSLLREWLQEKIAVSS